MTLDDISLFSLFFSLRWFYGCLLATVIFHFWCVRYHGDWKSETQTVVSLLAFMHWLETGTLVLHNEVEEKLGCKFSSLCTIFSF